MKETTKIEHINVTVNDPDNTAVMLEKLFGWKVRWSGASIDNGYTVHVGDADQYLALYRPDNPPEAANKSYSMLNGLNHIAFVVEDLDALEEKVTELGYTPINHSEYEPGRRFYFRDENNIEFELVSYT